MYKTLVGEARELITTEAKNKQIQEAIKVETEEQETHKILYRLFSFIYKKSVLQEVLVYWHKEVMEHIAIPELMHSNLAGQVGEYNDVGEIGYEKLLMQENIWDDHGGEPFTNYKATAIKYEGVYDRDLYIIPYKNPKNGFACRVVNTKTNQTKFFPHDIDRQYAIEWIADYLKKQQ